MRKTIRKIKITSSVAVVSIALVLTIGINALKDNPVFTKSYFVKTFNYFKYKKEYKNIYINKSYIEARKEKVESIPVLLYHGIIDKPDGANVLLENFKDQMFALKKAGWQTIGIEDFYAFMKGKKELPEKSFLLTFDDGSKSSYYPVDPILKALDYRAVSFIITKYSIGDKSGGNYYLSENELRKITKSGRWDLQSHSFGGHTSYIIDSIGTKGNFFGNKLWLEDKQRIETGDEFKKRIYNDFVNSKNDIENAFGKTVISFAYPLGDFGQDPVNFSEAKNIVFDTVKLVYPMSFYQVWLGNYFSFNYPEKENQLLIKRIEVRSYWNSDNLLKVLDIGKNKNLPYSDDFSGYNGWIKNYGQLPKLENNSMILSSSSTGSSVFIDGSYLWKNYIFKAKVYLKKGETYSIIAGYKDDSNYVYCSFTPLGIKLEQIVEGERKVLNEFKGEFNLLEKEKNIGIGFSGKGASCYLNDKRVIHASDVDEKLSNGGIGFESWGQGMNNSEIIIKEVSVEEIK